MPYKPTNNPPGRPRKIPLEASGKTPCPCGCGAFTDAAPVNHAKQAPGRAEMPFSDAPCCPVCDPAGWPAGVTGYGCEHGIWARRI